MAAGSMDNSTEYADMEWYDGSSWSNLETLGWEYNKQGWVEVHAVVPAGDLSTDNRVAFDQEGGGGDYTYIDRVVVSDVLHEYTAPAEPTNPDATGGSREATLTWDTNASFKYSEEPDWRRTSASSWTDEGWNHESPFTITGLLDGEAYEFRVREIVRQARRGSASNYWRTDYIYSPSAVTDLPAPTNLTHPSVGGTSADYDWTANHNYGDTRVEYKPTDESTWQTYTLVDHSVASEVVTGLRNRGVVRRPCRRRN